MRAEQLVPWVIGVGVLALICFGLPRRRNGRAQAARIAARYGWHLADATGRPGQWLHRWRGTAASGPWLLEIATLDPEESQPFLRWSTPASPARDEAALLMAAPAPTRPAGDAGGDAGWAARAALGHYLRGTFGVPLDAVPALRDARPPRAPDYPLRARYWPLFSDEATAARFLAACGPRLLAWDEEPPALLLWSGGLTLVCARAPGYGRPAGANPYLDPALCAAVVALGTGLLEDYRGARVA